MLHHLFEWSCPDTTLAFGALDWDALDEVTNKETFTKGCKLTRTLTSGASLSPSQRELETSLAKHVSILALMRIVENIITNPANEALVRNRDKSVHRNARHQLVICDFNKEFDCEFVSVSMTECDFGSRF